MDDGKWFFKPLTINYLLFSGLREDNIRAIEQSQIV